MNNGIATRHFAMPEIERVFDRTSDELNATFRTEAPTLAGRALAAALMQAGVHACDLDALIICTLQPATSVPRLTSYVRRTARNPAAMRFSTDLVGLGCRCGDSGRLRAPRVTCSPRIPGPRSRASPSKCAPPRSISTNDPGRAD